MGAAEIIIRELKKTSICCVSSNRYIVLRFERRFVILNLRDLEELHDCRCGDRGWYGGAARVTPAPYDYGHMKGCGVPSTLINKRHVATLEKYNITPRNRESKTTINATRTIVIRFKEKW